MDLIYYGFVVLVFIAVALLTEAGWQWWFSTQSRAAKRLGRRIQQVHLPATSGQARPVDYFKERRLAQSVRLDSWLQHVPGIFRLQAYIAQSGLSWSVASLLFFVTTGFFSGLFIALIFPISIVFAITLAALCALIPLLILGQRRNNRLKNFETQLPEAADLISRSLRAGHAFPVTVQMLADEMPNPIAAEFRIVADEINFGLPIAQSLRRLGKRVPLPDLQYLIVAVLIQRESGGNLSELMSKVSLIVRGRLKLLGDIRVMSAEGRLSAMILCLLPIAVALLFSFSTPDYLKRFLDDPAGSLLLISAVVMMALGMLWMRLIVRIRV